MSQNILITGGLGYLGGRLASYLSAKEEAVRLTTRPTGRPLPNWADRHEVFVADFGAAKLPEHLCSGIDTVIHLAALNAQQSAEDPEQAIQTNIIGTYNLINNAIAAGVKRFIYMSTAHVYGRPLEGTINEDTVPMPKHPYAWTHRAAEDVVNSATGIEGVVLRMTNAVGVPKDPSVNCWMLVANCLCREAIAEGSITLRGSGEDFRDFIAMNDVCRAMKHILDLSISGNNSKIYNLGGGGAVSIIEFAERIADRVALRFQRRPKVKRGLFKGKHQILDYRIDRLLGTGFCLKGNLDIEIDETLAFCANTLDPI